MWPQTGPEPDENVHALLCLTTGQVYRRNKWSRDWQKAHHDPQHTTHSVWPISDAGPFIAWRDGYGFDQVIKDAQSMATEFEELHRKWYNLPGYRDENAGYGRPRLAEAYDRIRRHEMQRTYDANEKAQATQQKLNQLRRLIGYLVPDDTQEWPATAEDATLDVREVEVIDLDKVRALLDRPDCGGAS